MHASQRLFRLTLTILAASGGIYCAHGATLHLKANDATGASSFNTIGNWVDGSNVAASSAPTSGNDYLVASSLVLRTPSGSGSSFTFGGDSLTLDTGTLAYKGGSGHPTITVNNLILKNGGAVSNFTPFTTTSYFNLAGAISVDSSGGAFSLGSTNGGIVVGSTISGNGQIAITTNQTVQAQGTVEFNHANNTYAGGTTIAQYTGLKVSADGALGTGNVTLNGGNLTFQSGTLNNYIADSANFIVASGLTTANASVVLSFTGTDSIGGLSLDGGSTFLGSGTYSTSALNTLYGANIFSGSGQFLVAAIPEPSTLALLAGVGVLGLALWRRRRPARA